LRSEEEVWEVFFGAEGEEEEKRCRWEMDVEREARKKTDKTTNCLHDWESQLTRLQNVFASYGQAKHLHTTHQT